MRQNLTAMNDVTPLYYTRTELESYLPSGWSLPPEGAEGHWDPQRKTWSITVLDGVDFQWSLTVAGPDAQAKGRLEALREAMDRLFRHRLGKPTRGLGLGKTA